MSLQTVAPTLPGCDGQWDTSLENLVPEKSQNTTVYFELAIFHRLDTLLKFREEFSYKTHAKF